MKTNRVKKSRPLKEKPYATVIEKEMEDLIEREKTKSSIVSKLLRQTYSKDGNTAS